MNPKNILLFGLVIIFIMSCRDKKKEEAEAAEMVQEVEAIETEIEENAKSLETDTKELEEALKELDSI